MDGDKKGITQENLNFLLEEYKQCYAHMRHYNNVKLSLSKFAFSFYSAIATITFALERYFYIEKSMNVVHLFLSGLLILTYTIGIMLIYLLVRNRLYFVRVARQTNSIRKLNISRFDFEFENFLFTDTRKPTSFNFKSTHILLILLFILINSIVLGFAFVFGFYYRNLDTSLMSNLSYSNINSSL